MYSPTRSITTRPSIASLLGENPCGPMPINTWLDKTQREAIAHHSSWDKGRVILMGGTTVDPPPIGMNER